MCPGVVFNYVVSERVIVGLFQINAISVKTFAVVYNYVIRDYVEVGRSHINAVVTVVFAYVVHYRVVVGTEYANTAAQETAVPIVVCKHVVFQNVVA